MKNKDKYWDKIIEALAYGYGFCPSEISETWHCSPPPEMSCKLCIKEWLEAESED